jgi:integrase
MQEVQGKSFCKKRNWSMAKGYAVRKSVGIKATTYYCRVRYKETTVSDNFRTKAAADSWGRDTVNQIDKGTFSRFLGDLEALTFSEAIDKWLEDPLVKKHKGYSVDFDRANRMKRYPFANKKLVKLQKADFREFRDTRRITENVAAQTIRNDFYVIKSIFGKASREWGFDNLKGKEIFDVELPASEEGRDKRLRKGEKENILEYAANDGRPWLLPFIKMALATGMRCGEIASIKPENINFEDHTVLLVHTKNGETRTAPLLPAAMKVLKEYKPYFEEDTIFGIKATTVTQAWMDIAQELNEADKLQDNWTFHDFRHEAISTFAEKYHLQNLSILQMLTGHKTLSSLQRYINLRAKEVVVILDNGYEFSDEV